jgi:hypothetical protein
MLQTRTAQFEICCCLVPQIGLSAPQSCAHACSYFKLSKFILRLSNCVRRCVRVRVRVAALRLLSTSVTRTGDF